MSKTDKEDVVNKLMKRNRVKNRISYCFFGIGSILLSLCNMWFKEHFTFVEEEFINGYTDKIILPKWLFYSIDIVSFCIVILSLILFIKLFYNTEFDKEMEDSKEL